MHARYYSPNLGRFLSVDPVGGTVGSSQSWNRYSYVLNNPIRMIDPDGEYQRDVHFDLTRVLALAAGFSPGHSKAIASANQATDAGLKSSWSPRSMASGYHFPDSHDLQDLRIDALQSNSTEDIGTYLHSLQDSFSHAGYDVIPGHIFDGHQPDITSNDPEKALEMAAATFEALVEFREQDPLLSFEEISSLVEQYLSLPQERNLNRQLNLQIIESMAESAGFAHDQVLSDPVSWE